MNFKLFVHIMSIEFRKILTYPWEFWFNFVGNVFIIVLISYFLWENIFSTQKIEVLGGMNLHELIIYYVIANLVNRILMGSSGTGNISQDIYKGQLNRYLVYPVSFLRFKFAGSVGHSLFYFLQLLLILGIAILLNLVKFTAGGLLMGLAIIWLSVITFFLISAITEQIAFWADNVWSLAMATQFILSFCSGLMIPLQFFPVWGQKILNMLPFAHMVYWPIIFIQGKAGMAQFQMSAIILVGWSAILAVISKILWVRGQYRYTGVGI